MSRITTEQKVQVSVRPLTAAGHDAKIDGPVQFASSDENVAAIIADSDRAATVYAKGPGVAQITAQFDADLGEGVRTVSLSGALEVVEAEAVAGEIQFGEPELQ